MGVLWMIVPVVCVFVLVFFLLLLLIKIKFFLFSKEGNFHVSAAVGPVKLQMYPGSASRKSKKKRFPGKKDAKKAKAKGKDPSETKWALEPHDLVQIFLALVDEIAKALGKFCNTLRVERLYVHATVGGENPASVGILYGSLSAVVGLIYPFVSSRFTIVDPDIRVDADFNKNRSEITIDSIFTIRLLWVLTSFLGLGIEFLKKTKNIKKEKVVPSS